MTVDGMRDRMRLLPESAIQSVPFDPMPMPAGAVQLRGKRRAVIAGESGSACARDGIQRAGSSPLPNHIRGGVRDQKAAVGSDRDSSGRVQPRDQRACGACGRDFPNLRGIRNKDVARCIHGEDLRVIDLSQDARLTRRGYFDDLIVAGVGDVHSTQRIACNRNRVVEFRSDRKQRDRSAGCDFANDVVARVRHQQIAEDVDRQAARSAELDCSRRNRVNRAAGRHHPDAIIRRVGDVPIAAQIHHDAGRRVELCGGGGSVVAAEVLRCAASRNGFECAAGGDLQDEKAARREQIAGVIHGHVDGRSDSGNLLRKSSEVTGGRDVERALEIERQPGRRGRIEHGDDDAAVDFANAIVAAVGDVERSRGIHGETGGRVELREQRRQCHRPRIQPRQFRPQASACHWRRRYRPGLRRNRKCRGCPTRRSSRCGARSIARWWLVRLVLRSWRRASLRRPRSESCHRCVTFRTRAFPKSAM